MFCNESALLLALVIPIGPSFEFLNLTCVKVCDSMSVKFSFICFGFN